MEAVTLFELKNEGIKISITAYFEKDILVIDGYDIGKTVEEYWGDSDYEYVLRIPSAGISFLYKHLNVFEGDQQALLHVLAKRYNSNSCFSEIRQLLDDNKVSYEGFTWT